MSRDWTTSLFPASYNGVAFWVRLDAHETGRRLKVDDLPGADNPHIEDLGRRQRRIEITGYFVGDSSDGQMAAMEAACELPTTGVLVMPAQGPLPARCMRVKRRRDRDKMGFFGFDAEFVRDDGFAGSAPASFLGQQVFSGVASLASAASGFLSSGVSL